MNFKYRNSKNKVCFFYLKLLWKVRRRRSVLVNVQTRPRAFSTHRECGVAPVYTGPGKTTFAKAIVRMTSHNDNEHT